MPIGAYTASFTVDATVAGFDIQTNGYSSTVEANVVVTPIPWSQPYTVVIQRGGLNPLKRSYRALVYSEDDFRILGLLVNVPGGTLVTPREPNGVPANLDRFSRTGNLDQNDPNGLTTVTLEFTILQ